ncbi:TonB-dependent receptor [Actinobacillus equuli]|nr:TonB-dependent receptor [Actinobacillus equuli]
MLGGGDLSQCVGFTNKDELVAPPIVSLDPSCSKDDIKEAPEYCVLTYPGKIGTDKLERPATNAPRVPPVRLGFRWQGYFDQNWSANLEYIHVFTQNVFQLQPLRLNQDCIHRKDVLEMIVTAKLKTT